MHDILSKHIEHLCVRYDIKDSNTFSEIEMRDLAWVIKELRARLQTRHISANINEAVFPGRTAFQIHIWPSAQPDTGLAVVLSRLAPFYFSEWITIEGLRDIDLQSVAKVGLEGDPGHQDYLRSLKRPIPKELEQLREQIIAELSALNFIWVPRDEFDRVPPESPIIPKSLHDRTLEYFYFHSVD
jgi:hypothetical protein